MSGNPKSQEAQLEAEKLELTRARAEKENLLVAKLKQELVSSEEATLAVCTMVNNFKVRMLGIPDKATLRIRSAPSDAEGKEILKKQINEALKELSQQEI